MISIRNAEKKDAATIRRMVIFAGLNPTRLDWQRFTVAVDEEDRVIGCVQRKPHRDGSMELASLVVVEDRRGQGIARALIESMVAEHRGALNLMCRAELGAYYQKFGFTALAPDQMTVYFRRIARFVGEKVLIMGREC